MSEKLTAKQAAEQLLYKPEYAADKSADVKEKAAAFAEGYNCLLYTSLLHEKYGITERDFTRAEIEVVPAHKARDVRFDRSMAVSYTHLDVCKRQAMDIAVGDTILTRKKHPCGASSFEVLRVGMDFKIRCTGCGREVMLPRAKIEKNIKKVVKPGQA